MFTLVSPCRICGKRSGTRTGFFLLRYSVSVCYCNSTNAPEFFKKQCSFENRGALDKKVLSLFILQRNGKKGSIHYTGLFKMIVVVQLSSGNSPPNLGNNHHMTIPFEGGMHSFKRQGAFVSRN